MPSRTITALMFALLSAATLAAVPRACAEDGPPPPCNEDAMIVFDASGSMSGSVGLGIATPITRMDEVRNAFRKVLPSASKMRRIGLITYGPGPYQQCNVSLDLKPTANAAALIMSKVDSLTPAGRTPLASAVQQAADVLDYRSKPGVIVVVTDGEETCGGAPCALGQQLHAAASQLTIHVIGYRPKGFSWTGEQSIVDARCLADNNAGLYISAETADDLVQALTKTLDCPMVTEKARLTPRS
jgi:Ca-activated chloride channel family protein